ncbi:MAG: hypothetical protein ACXVZ4_11035 [Gaiellaceae bacterium]
MIRIRITDRGYAESLRDFLLRIGAAVDRTSDPHVLLATLPGALSAAHERRELANYLRTWRQLAPGCAAELLDD